MAGKVGSVMVIGGGIGGMQSALDLANSGFKVYLVEKEPSIGGRMAQLDKTFPTNDCSMCIEAPKMVDVARHQNIDLLTYSEVEKVGGEAGDFTVKVRKKARYVDIDKCVGCGACAEVCRLKGRVDDIYNQKLTKRSAIYVPFPQAVPLKYTIDPEKCLFIRAGKCGESPPCMDACEAGAIDHGQKDEVVDVSVGAIIMSVGFDPFDASRKPEYGYGRFKNVITSLEYERLMSASGPTEGHITRPSDHEEPGKIAFIQCVGSRDERTNTYCSSVCCTYAVKQCIITKEHAPHLETHIFSMDERTFGRGFEDFRIRAEKEYGVKTIRNNRVPSIEEIDNQNLLIKFVEDGELKSEEYGLVVLSIGLEPSSETRSLTDRLGIEVNEFGFVKTDTLEPLQTSKPGIFINGLSSGPKDIPDTVAQASGAAGKAAGIVAEKRGTLVEGKVYPDEKDVSAEEPRIGVLVCHCGINIGGVVNVPSVAEYAKTLPHVAYATDNLYSCSQDAQDMIKNLVKEHNLNRLVVASCTPRTHEPLFQDTIHEAGLNPYLFEMANIRDQCSWVHMQKPEEATAKAKELVKMAVAKAALIEPLERTTVGIIPTALVLGGGLAGMTAALELSKQGFKSHLIEAGDELGGNLRCIGKTIDGKDVTELIFNLVDLVGSDPNITIHMNAKLDKLDGYVGNFHSTLTNGEELEHGAIIVAVGGNEYSPKEYGYGSPKVMTIQEFEEKKPDFDSVAIIHCVGARNDENTECGRICCTTAIKTALAILDEKPDATVYELFRDMRTYGFKESYYKEAAEKGVNFIRFRDGSEPAVTENGGKLQIDVKDAILGRELRLHPDIILLSAAVRPNEDNEHLAMALKVPRGKDGFFLEAHVKLRPLDFATEGIFVCGLAQGPKFMDETLSQACGAVARACTILSKEKMAAGGMISVVDEDLCGGCGTCEAICPYHAIVVDRSDPTNLKAKVNDVLCKACGCCSAACPEHAIHLKHFTNAQIMAQIKALAEED